MGGIGLMAWIGGIAIAVVLVFAVIANRRRSNADRQRTEEGTRTLYRDMDRQDKVSDPDPERF